MTLHQLRIYTVRAGDRHAFYVRGENHARPLLREHGFEFGYLLAWESEEHLRLSWTAPLADERWQQAKALTKASGEEPVVMSTGRLIEARSEMPPYRRGLVRPSC